MKRPTLRSYLFLVIALFIVAFVVWRARPVRGSDKETLLKNWNSAAAAGYLDRREIYWEDWPKARRQHGTVCISCHTNVPYAIARPALQEDLHEPAAPAPEQALLKSVDLRVNDWSRMSPFYSDESYGPGKAVQSHSTEAVMNAVLLASYDKREGNLHPTTQAALNNAWALQQTTGEDAGGWLWQDFHLAPWESVQSAYQGAAMLMLEVGTAPNLFIRTQQSQAHLSLLQQYLRSHYAAQPLLNQIYVLWASAQVPGLLSQEQQQSLFASLTGLQEADGGWNLSSLESWQRSDKTPQSTASDGLATALVVLCMQASPAERQDVSLQRGLNWLGHHQDTDGHWRAPSLNEDRDPDSNIGLFMSDAATAYAALALEQAKASALALSDLPHPGALVPQRTAVP